MTLDSQSKDIIHQWIKLKEGKGFRTPKHSQWSISIVEHLPQEARTSLIERLRDDVSVETLRAKAPHVFKDLAEAMI